MVKQPEYIIKTEADYDTAIYIIENTVVHRDETPFLDTKRDIGEDGLIIGSKIETPYEALIDYLGPRNWITEPQNRPKEFKKLLKAYERKVEEICKIIADSPSEIVLVGSICEPQTPELFYKYYLPHLIKYAQIMHKKGKIVGIRARSLWLESIASLIAEAGLDFIEAITPPPAGNLSLSKARAMWGSKVIIWINFPETVFWSGARETYRYTSELIYSDAPGDHLIMGLADLGSSRVINPTTRNIVKNGLLALVDALKDIGICPVNPENPLFKTNVVR
jgi:hypothetical protein